MFLTRKQDPEQVSVQELHKPVIEKIKRSNVYPRFKDNIWAAGLAKIRSFSSFSCGAKYLLYHRYFH